MVAVGMEVAGVWEAWELVLPLARSLAAHSRLRTMPMATLLAIMATLTPQHTATLTLQHTATLTLQHTAMLTRPHTDMLMRRRTVTLTRQCLTTDMPLPMSVGEFTLMQAPAGGIDTGIDPTRRTIAGDTLNRSLLTEERTIA